MEKVKETSEYRVYEKNFNGIYVEVNVHGAVDMRTSKTMPFNLDINLLPNMDAGKSYSNIVDLLNERSIEAYAKSSSSKTGLGIKDIVLFLKEIKNDLIQYKINYKANVKELTTSLPTKVNADPKVIQYLKAKNLIGRYIEDMASIGVVGKKADIVLMLLTSVSRLSSTPIALNCIGNARLVKDFFSCIPDEKLIKENYLSEQSLFYFRNDLKEKIMLLDKDNMKPQQLDDLIQLCQHGISKISPIKNKEGEMVNNKIGSTGKVSLVFYSDCERLVKNEYVFNRHIQLTEEEINQLSAMEQMSYEDPLEYAQIEIRKAFMIQLQNALKPYRVMIPELSKYTKEFGFSERVKLVKLIQATTLLHQHQRDNEKINGTTYLVASKEDIQLGAELLKMLQQEEKEVLTPRLRLIWEKWQTLMGEKKLVTSIDFKMENKLESRNSSKILSQLEDAGLIRLTQRVKGIYNVYTLIDMNKEGGWNWIAL